MTTVCVDASFLLGILLGDESMERAIDWWNRGLNAGREFLAPPLFFAEVTSVIRWRVYSGALQLADAGILLNEALARGVSPWHGDNVALQRRAFELATRFNRPKAYDAQYLAVADLLGCELWTADRRLANAVGKELAWVRYVGAEA